MPGQVQLDPRRQWLPWLTIGLVAGYGVGLIIGTLVMPDTRGDESDFLLIWEAAGATLGCLIAVCVQWCRIALCRKRAVKLNAKLTHGEPNG